MTRPTELELAIECDCWRELAEARSVYFRNPSSKLTLERIAAANEALRALGISNFTPPARERISEPERLGDILKRSMCDEAYESELDEASAATDEPSEIAQVIGDCLDVGPKR